MSRANFRFGEERAVAEPKRPRSTPRPLSSGPFSQKLSVLEEFRQNSTQRLSFDDSSTPRPVSLKEALPPPPPPIPSSTEQESSEDLAPFLAKDGFQQRRKSSSDEKYSVSLFGGISRRLMGSSSTASTSSVSTKGPLRFGEKRDIVEEKKSNDLPQNGQQQEDFPTETTTEVLPPPPPPPFSEDLLPPPSLDELNRSEENLARPSIDWDDVSLLLPEAPPPLPTEGRNESFSSHDPSYYYEVDGIVHEEEDICGGQVMYYENELEFMEPPPPPGMEKIVYPPVPSVLYLYLEQVSVPILEGNDEDNWPTT